MQLRKCNLFFLILLVQQTQTVKVGGGCNDHTECQISLGNLSTCNEIGNAKECHCILDISVASTDETKCLKILNRLEQECKETAQCQVENSTCSSHNGKMRCTCLADLIESEDKSRCLPKIKLLEQCEEHGQCSDLSSKCTVDPDNTESRRCYCDALHYESNFTDTSQCLPRNELGDDCNSEAECKPEGSTCVGHKCACDITHYPQDGKCVEKKAIGGACSNDVQCKPSNSMCNSNGKCACISTHYGWVNPEGVTECLKKKDLGTECTQSIECKGNQSVCDLVGAVTRCTCKDPFVHSDKKDDCLMKKNLNETCTDVNQCTGATAESTCDAEKKICMCTNSTVEFKVNGVVRCLKIANFGGTCEVKEQCSIIDGDCINDKCHCLEDQIPVAGNTKCVGKAKLGEPCEDDSQCVADDSTCISIEGNDQTCSCNSPNLVGSEDGLHCIQTKVMDAECIEQAQCSAITVNSGCFEGQDGKKRCSCEENSVKDESNEKGKRCLAKAGLQGECEKNAQCTVENSECDGGRCTCAKGYKASQDSAVCNNGATPALQWGVVLVAILATMKFQMF